MSVQLGKSAGKMGPLTIYSPIQMMNSLKFILINSGWKVGERPKADLYIDCRGIPNPFHDLSLKGMSGDAFPVQAWVMEHGQDQIKSALDLILSSLNQIPDRRLGEDKPFDRPYVVCFMCAHGIHRSRAMKHILSNRLKAGGWMVEVQ